MLVFILFKRGEIKIETYLAHHDILGMKWGVRRYQNYDGTLTDAGKKHVSDGSASTRRTDNICRGVANLTIKAQSYFTDSKKIG